MKVGRRETSPTDRNASGSANCLRALRLASCLFVRHTARHLCGGQARLPARQQQGNGSVSRCEERGLPTRERKTLNPIGRCYLDPTPARASGRATKHRSKEPLKLTAPSPSHFQSFGADPRDSLCLLALAAASWNGASPFARSATLPADLPIPIPPSSAPTPSSPRLRPATRQLCHRFHMAVRRVHRRLLSKHQRSTHEVIVRHLGTDKIESVGIGSLTPITPDSSLAAAKPPQRPVTNSTRRLIGRVRLKRSSQMQALVSAGDLSPAAPRAKTATRLNICDRQVRRKLKKFADLRTAAAFLPQKTRTHAWHIEPAPQRGIAAAGAD